MEQKPPRPPLRFIGASLPPLPFMPLPKFLFDFTLSMTARVLYAVLLDRVTLSQKNQWLDEQGNAFVYFPVEKLAKTLHRSRSSICRALAELEHAGLLRKCSTAQGGANRLLLKYPPDAAPKEPESAEICRK